MTTPTSTSTVSRASADGRRCSERRPLALLWIGLFLCHFSVNVSAIERPPNVVIFLADDAGWGDFGRSGNRMVETPHIDSLARDGVSLERFFVCPVCSPTRAEFLTGRYHPRGGVQGVSTGYERLDLSESTVAQAFQAAGYATGAFGKWHNGSQWPYHPLARGFDRFFGYTAGHWGEYFDPPLEDQGHLVKTRGYIVDICTDRALSFIESNRERPFFCYLPMTTPHTPWAVPDRDWHRWRDRDIDQRGRESDSRELNETRCALAMIENQDDNVGRVLNQLQRLGLTENTIVVYFSDNGPNTWRWNGELKGKKGSTDEGGVRSVCFLRWPGHLPRDRQVHQIAGAIDLLPTLTSLANAPPVGDQPLDGVDLSPLLLDPSTAWPDRTLFTTWAGRISAGTDRYRMDATGHLFDVSQDPGQTSPIEAAHPELAARLGDSINAWRTEMFGTQERSSSTTRPAVDPRPLTVGYREFPVTMLPARDGAPHGNIRRSSVHPNSSYFLNWIAESDSIHWQIEVRTAGRYAVAIDYTVPLADVGATIELACGNSQLTGQVAPPWDPPILTNQDTLPRANGESPMKEFHTLEVGEIELAEGLGELTLRALSLTGETVMDLRRVTLTLLPE